MHSNVAAAFPTIPARAGFDQSAVAYAHRSGVNAVELDGLAQAISRLVRDHNTVVPLSMKDDLVEFEQLGYVELVPTGAGTLSVTLKCATALLSSYFWSVWVPRHLLSCAMKVSVVPHLKLQDTAQHCTVVFRIPGTREAAREFLSELATQYPGHAPEIVAIQAGHALSTEAGNV